MCQGKIRVCYHVCMGFSIQAIFIILFLIEGLGIVQNHSILFYLYLIASPLLVAAMIRNKKRFVFPPIISSLFFVFLIIVLFSAFHFSVDKQISFEYWLLYANMFLLFIYWYNNKEEGKILTGRMIRIGTVVFFLAYVVKTLFLKNSLINVFPKNEFNLFSSYASLNHNHLGDFIGLAIIMIVWNYFVFNKKQFVAFILFIGVVLYSFSRSAYVSLFFTFLFILWRNRGRVKEFKKHIIAALIFFLLFFGMSLLLGRGLKTGYGKKFTLANVIQVPYKNIFGGRIGFFSQALQSSRERPLFGLGPGNFIYASVKYRQDYFSTAGTSFNLFLDILVGNGIFAFLAFFSIVFLITRSAFKKTSLFSVFFLYMLLNFQTNYIYQIYGVLFLFVISGAVTYEEKNEAPHTIMYAILSLFLFILSALIIASKLFLLHGQAEIARQLYPLNKEAYYQLIQNAFKEKDYDSAHKWINQYFQISPDDTGALLSFGDLYNTHKQSSQALTYYERAYKIDHFIPFPEIEKMYLIKKEVSSLQKASVFIENIFVYYKSLFTPWQIHNYYKDTIVAFCKKTKEKACIKEGFLKSLPVPKTLKAVN